MAAQALKEQLKRRLYFEVGDKEKERPDQVASPTDGWEGVAGMRELKAILERDVLLPLQEPELYRRYKLEMPKGILLYGPPGCGKTYVARALAKHLSYSFREVKPSDLASKYIHETQKRIGQLFREARESAPALLFFDELDALVPDRGAQDVHQYQAAEVNKFLIQLNDCKGDEVLVIGATNIPKKIDPAVMRPGRFDKKICIGPPDIEARLDGLKMFLEGRPQQDIEWVPVAECTEEYSFAELEHVVNEAARIALSERRDITTQDLLDAADRNPPQPKDGYLKIV